MFLTPRSAEDRYNQWVHAHYRFLMRSAWALTGSRAVAEDVVQECFALAWEHRTQLREEALARAWLARPEVVLLDEVSMGLAPLIIDEIFLAIGELRATGTAMASGSAT